MISLFKKQVAEIHQMVWGNPLFLYRWRHFSIYTWFNLTVLFTVLMAVFATIVRLFHYLEVQSVLGQCPGFQQELMASFMPDQWRFAFLPRVSEITWIALQFGALGLMYVLLLFGASWDLWLWHRQCWNHPASQQIRILPLPPSQVQFALADLRFYLVSSFIMFCTLLHFVPAIDLRFYLEFQLLPDININHLALHALWLWMAIFAIYRTIQFQQRLGNNIFDNPMFGRWLIAILLWLTFPFCIYELGGFLYGEILVKDNSIKSYIELYTSLSFYASIMASLLLFISCLTLKHHLFPQQKK